jgi:uncharacterized protein
MKKLIREIEFQNAVSDLVSLPQVQQLRRYRHHRATDRYTHTMRVARWSFRLARRLGLDERAAARGAMLHDLFFHDKSSRPADYGDSVLLHHPEEAAENAKRVTQLTDKEENIILSHMWPLSRHAPRSAEAVLVNLVDDVVAVGDFGRR